MSAPKLEDYVEVNERIAAFLAKYPEGSLQTVGWDVRAVGDKTFIVYHAAAYRHPGDKRPGHGNAWEPFPGPTPYTRDSELMNAETAAWGRACVALGILSNRKVASRQEVQARSTVTVPGPDGQHAEVSVEPYATPDDVEALKRAAGGLTVKQIKGCLAAQGLKVPTSMSVAAAFGSLPQAKTAAVASALSSITRIPNAVPSVEAPDPS
jgi:hypothetical protein